MTALGLSATDPAFPELKDEDTYYKDVNFPNELNDGAKTEGWIWTIGRAGTLTAEERNEYAEDAARVQWFSAEMQRFQEEVEILSQEFRNASRGFARMGEVWAGLGSESSHPGTIAYAKHKAWMFNKMAAQCRDKFAGVGGTWPATGVSLAAHIWAERPRQTVDWSVAVSDE